MSNHISIPEATRYARGGLDDLIADLMPARPDQEDQ